MPGRFNEPDTPVYIGRIITDKIVSFQKQKHPAAALVTYRLTLPIINGTREQKPIVGTG